MALLPLLLVLVLAAAAATGATVVRRSPPSRETTVAAARRHAALSATAAFILAACAAVGTAIACQMTLPPPVRNGLTVLSLPVVFGIAHTGVLLLGELTWPRPESNVRRARLLHRGMLDAAPRWLIRLAAAAALAAVVVLTGGGLVAAPDGRTVTVPAGGNRISSSASPFAGADYGWPVTIALAVLAALTTAALWVVANRPAVVTAEERIEEALRRASAFRVLRGAVSAALVVVGGVLTVSGAALRSAATSAADTAAANDLPIGAAATVLPWAGGALAVVGLLAALTGLVLVCVRAPGVPADVREAA